MNKTQSKHFRMFLNTQGYADEQTNVWNKIPRVVTYKNDFDELLARISEVSKVAMEGVGVTERKTQLKKILGIKVAQLSGVMLAYAYEIDDMDLLKKVKTTESDIDRLKEADVESKVATIVKITEKYLSSLADFGVTPDLLTELSTTLDEYNALIGKPRIIMNKKYVALSSLDELFDEVNALLKNKLDKIMLMFKYNSNGFYEGYEPMSLS